MLMYQLGKHSCWNNKIDIILLASFKTMDWKIKKRIENYHNRCEEIVMQMTVFLFGQTASDNLIVFSLSC